MSEHQRQTEEEHRCPVPEDLPADVYLAELERFVCPTCGHWNGFLWAQCRCGPPAP